MCGVVIVVEGCGVVCGEGWSGRVEEVWWRVWWSDGGQTGVVVWW